MQERSDGSLFVQLVFGGKSKRVDSAKFVIGRIGDRAFDGSSAAAIGRLPQNTEEGFRLAHLTPLAPPYSLSRQRILARQGLAQTGRGRRLCDCVVAVPRGLNCNPSHTGWALRPPRSIEAGASSCAISRPARSSNRLASMHAPSASSFDFCTIATLFSMSSCDQPRE